MVDRAAAALWRRAWCALACAGLAMSGCAIHAASGPQERLIPLPPGSVDVAGVDDAHLAVLVRDPSGHSSVAIVEREAGVVTARFNVPTDTVAIAPDGPLHVYALGARPATSVLGVYSVGGAREQAYPLPGVALSVAAPADDEAFVLLRRGGGRAVVEVQTARRFMHAAIPAPPGAESLAVSGEAPAFSLLVSDASERLWERLPGGLVWHRLGAAGSDPVYSDSGNAIYALQPFDGNGYVAVIARPFNLPARLFPVERSVGRLGDGRDGSLVLLQHDGDAWNARSIACRSPLLAVRAFVNKHGRYFDEGHFPDPGATLPPTPEPAYTGDEC